MKDFQFRITPDETGEAPSGGRLQTRSRRPSADQLVHLDRTVEPFHRHRPERFHLDVAFAEPQRLAGDEHGACRRNLLHPGGEVRRLADGRVVHVEVAADRPHHHLSRIQPHSDLYRNCAGPPDFVTVPAHALLHPERGIAGPDSVVLVRDRRAEERHDPVAHDLVDGALVTVDGVHHALEHGVEELPGLLGVAVGEELHRALEVGEEDRDLLALAFEGTLGRQDFLGEVLRGVGLRGGEAAGRLSGQ